MSFAATWIQVWLSGGVGVDTLGPWSKQLQLGFDGVTRDGGLPVAGGLFLSLGIAETPDGLDRSRVGVGCLLRVRVHRWILVGGAVETGSQEREVEGDRLFVAADVRVAVPFTPDARYSLELAAGAQGEKAISLFGEKTEGASAVNVAARLVVRL